MLAECSATGMRTEEDALRRAQMRSEGKIRPV